MTRKSEVAIIGAGPIGLELAVALKHAGVDYVQIDAGQIGQTISGYPRQVRFFSSPERIAIAGVPLQTVDQAKASREEYLAYLREVVQQFDLPIHTYERVISTEKTTDGFRLQTVHHGQAHTYDVRYVVMAIGDMHRPRMLNIPGEAMEHVSHYFDEPHRYFQQKLLIVGGKNSAAEAAIRCYRAGAHVTMSYRGLHLDPKAVKYWILPELQGLIKAGHIRFLPGTMPTAITANSVTLSPSGVEAVPAAGVAEEVRVEADFVLLLIGYEMDTRLLEMAGVQIVGENRAPKVDMQTMRSNVPGLFVAGTAVAGTQDRFRLFIENCHVHVSRIVKAITGNAPPAELVNQAGQRYDLPET
jgi:thioredoxin reductase (NADPH)